MVIRGWAGSIAAAAGVAAAFGAAQLGLGYGMDVISFMPDDRGQLPTEAWIASLTWATWIAGTSTVLGAMMADRLSSGPVRRTDAEPGSGPDAGGAGSGPTGELGRAPDKMDPGVGILWRLALAAAAAVGAGVTVVLVAVPARLAEPAGVSSSQAVAAATTSLGLIAGLLVGVGALAARAVAANVVATATWLWLLAVVAVVDGVVAGQDWQRVPLAFWEFTTADPFRGIFLPDAGLAVGAALLVGALAGLPAARRGDHPVGVVLSGAAGPLVLAAAYLIARPDLAGVEPVDLSRHLIVPYLVVAGLLGSLVATAVRQRSGSSPVSPTQAAIPAARGRADAPEPTPATAD